MLTQNNPYKVAVYCASSTQIDPQHFADGHRFGQLLADAGMTLVFGAGNMGIMGAVADGVIERGGQLIGVIPEFMVANGWHHQGCTEIIQTQDMADRKTTIWQQSDALVVLPGGIGTLDELSEVMVLKQLGRHQKPIVIYNPNGFYDTLIDFLNQMVDKRFLHAKSRDMFVVATEVEDIIPAIERCPEWGMENTKHAKM